MLPVEINLVRQYRHRLCPVITLKNVPKISNSMAQSSSQRLAEVMRVVLSSRWISSLFLAVVGETGTTVPSCGMYNTVLPSIFQRVSVKLAMNLCSWATKSLLMLSKPTASQRSVLCQGTTVTIHVTTQLPQWPVNGQQLPPTTLSTCY